MRCPGYRFANAELVLGLVCVAAACSTSPGTSGDACTRSAQCEPGLACIEGECSGDPQALGAQGQVPMLMPEPVDAGRPDAGALMDAGAQAGAGGAGAGAGGAGAG